VTRGVLVAAAIIAVFALILPAWSSHYGLSVATAMLYLAFTGQAWNVMMGFAGQLSLGHALYVGLGAYVAAGLFVYFGLGPWLGLWAGMAAAAASSLVIGWLAFRFRVAGVYFAVLTIASAEFTRIGFDHLEWTGGPAGLFLKVAQRDAIDVLNLRGPPAMYYYAILLLALGALALCTRLLRSRVGYYWLAIREDEQAAEALGIPTMRFKLLAVVVSAALTSMTSPDTGANSSDTAFTDSIVPKACPFVTAAPPSGSSTNTTSPSCFCAKSVIPTRPTPSSM